MQPLGQKNQGPVSYPSASSGQGAQTSAPNLLWGNSWTLPIQPVEFPGGNPV
jgi:hypothetical protein